MHASRHASRRAWPRRLLVAGLACLLAAVGGPAPARAADPEWAAVGSLLLPGVGQALNGDVAAGAAHGTLYLVLANQYRQRIDHPDYIPFDEREDEATDSLRINRTTAIADGYGSAALNLAFYSAFGAYRDARAQPANAAGYTTPPPEESLAELALSPFRWEFLRRPTTVAPLLVPLYLVLAPAGPDRLVYAPDSSISRDELRGRFFARHGMVAVGEEAFFRGFLNNGLSDSLGRGWGLAASSALFGLGHTGSGAQATAVGAALFGAYLGWLQQENDYAIGQGVAIHFWWNFLTSLALLKQRDADAHVVPFALHLRF